MKHLSEKETRFIITTLTYVGVSIIGSVLAGWTKKCAEEVAKEINEK